MSIHIPNANGIPLKTDQVFQSERVIAHKRSRFNPIRGLTPQILAQQLDSFKVGYLRDLALTMDAIEERDDVLQSVAPKRKKSVSRNGWEILTMDDSPEAERHKEVLEYFYNNCTATHVLDENNRGSFKLLVRQMMDSVGKRYACHEIVWQPAADGTLTAEFRFVPLWFFENTTGRLRFLTQEYAIAGVPLEQDGWLITCGDGLNIACSIAYIFKHLPLKDWLNYTEAFGFPIVDAATDAPKGSDEWNALKDAVDALANDLRIVRNRSSEINLLQVGKTGDMPFSPLVERMDRAMARLWRGADLSTLSRNEGAGASLQGDETDLLTEDDAETVSETLNMQVDAPVIQWHFGRGVKPLAYIRILGQQKDDLDRDIKVDEFLLSHGGRLSLQDTFERYSRAIPDDDEETLSAPAPAAPFGMPLSSPFGARQGAEEQMTEDEGRMANEDAFRRNAVDALAQATAEDLQPVRKRLERILQIEDPEILSARLTALLRELPSLLRDINADPAGAQTMESILSGAAVDGLTKRNQEEQL